MTIEEFEEAKLTDREMAETTGHTLRYLLQDKILIGKFRNIAEAQLRIAYDKKQIYFADEVALAEKKAREEEWEKIKAEWLKGLRIDWDITDYISQIPKSIQDAINEIVRLKVERIIENHQGKRQALKGGRELE